MAKAKSNSGGSKLVKKTHRKRPGVHAKTKNSRSKQSKHYKKKYKGQGK